jgi:pSer/pThr/pTyr-binding forkhead associated (FHA) protein
MGIKLEVYTKGGEKHSYTFDQQRVVIGRGKGVDILLPSQTVSNVHAIIQLIGHDYFISDMGSTNGTLLNGNLLVPNQKRLLKSEDKISISEFEITFFSGVPTGEAHSAERTGTIARKIALEIMQGLDSKEMSPYIIVCNAGKDRLEIPQLGSQIIIGRSPSSNLVLEDQDVSREHAILRRTLDGVEILDLGSKNGVYVNNKLVSEVQSLKDGDEILLGSTKLEFYDPVEAYLKSLESATDKKLTQKEKKDMVTDKVEKVGDPGKSSSEFSKVIIILLLGILVLVSIAISLVILFG